MFFDFIPNTLTTLTILFPLYASHKALSAPPAPTVANATALFTPWLTYFLVLSLFHLAESYTPILPSLPFYAFVRLALHIYLLLPGPRQGSTFIYTTYIAPFLARHEAAIEDFIRDAHDRLRAVPAVDFALAHATAIWAYLLRRIFGREPKPRDREREAAHSPPTSNSYVASLLGRFIAPEAEGRGAMGLLSALGSAGATAGRGLMPAHLGSDGERLGYIASERERLRGVLSALEKEEEMIHLAAAASGSGGGARGGIGRSRSEYEFETIGREDVRDEGRPGAERRTSRGWGAWMLGRGEDAGRSSGVDTGR